MKKSVLILILILMMAFCFSQECHDHKERGDTTVFPITMISSKIQYTGYLSSFKTSFIIFQFKLDHHPGDTLSIYRITTFGEKLLQRFPFYNYGYEKCIVWHFKPDLNQQYDIVIRSNSGYKKFWSKFIPYNQVLNMVGFQDFTIDGKIASPMQKGLVIRKSTEYPLGACRRIPFYLYRYYLVSQS